MRGKISETDREYVKELEEAIEQNSSFGDILVTIDDQLMTAKQAVELLKSDDLTSRTYFARRN